MTLLKTSNLQQGSQVIEPVPYHDIIIITDTVLQIDVEGLLKKDAQALNKVRMELNRYAEGVEENLGGLVTEFNWNKIKDLEFRENLAQKQFLLSKILQCQCNKCPDLRAHVRLAYCVLISVSSSVVLFFFLWFLTGLPLRTF